MTGPGFDQVHSQDTTLIGLTPGSYTIAAANLNAEGQLYLPNPASQGVAVAAGLQAAQALVGYSLAPATLTLTVSGLPNGTAAAADVKLTPAQVARLDEAFAPGRARGDGAPAAAR